MFNGYTGESSKPRLRIYVYIYIYPGIQGGFIQCFHSRHIILFSYFIRTSPANIRERGLSLIHYLVKPELDKGIKELLIKKNKNFI